MNQEDPEIKALAEAMTVGDQVWLESARRRMIAGEAPHLEIFFLSHRYGRPKDQDRAPDRPPILFISQYGQPGDYDPLARAAEPSVRAHGIAHERALPAVPPDLPRGATGANGDGADSHGPGDDGEGELVLIRG